MSISRPSRVRILGIPGLLFRNTGVAKTDGAFIVEESGRTWPLLELLEWVPHGWRRPARAKLQTAVGRNVDLFLSLCKAAGREAVTDGELEAMAWTFNGEFGHPLNDPEVEGVLRNVRKYRERWAANGWHRPSFRRRQAARGRRSGKVRASKAATAAQAALELRGEGLTHRAIAEALGAGVRTVKRYLAPEGATNQHQIDGLGSLFIEPTPATKPTPDRALPPDGGLVSVEGATKPTPGRVEAGGGGSCL